MGKQLESIVLLDDNFSTNFIHKKFISKTGCAKSIMDFQSGIDALEYLSSELNPLPELIFLDINMPIMNAWDFVEQFKKLQRPNREDTIIILLTTSLSPKDEEMASNVGQINDIWIKPLSVEKVRAIIGKYFPECLLK